MSKPNFQPPKNPYDPRWFIWTIVFLVVTGISLVSYILLSETPSGNEPVVITTHAQTKKPAK